MRAVQLTLFDERGERLGRAQTGIAQTFAAPRGALLDASGAELAVTVHAPSVFARPAAVTDAAATARVLAPLLGRSVAALEKQLTAPSPFVFLARWTSAATARAVRARALPGVGVSREPRRSYPLGALAGPVIGFANIDGVGVRGVEQAEDAWLRGGTARAQLERDARGRLLAREGFDPNASAGFDVALHLDATLQDEMESALADVVRRSGARGGLAVALKAESGALLGAAEYPGMDPNAFRTLPYPRTRSRVFLDAFEPGSVLKPLVVAAALELDALRADELIDCEDGTFRVPGKTLRDLKPNGLLDPAGLLRVSSNIGVAKIAYRLAPRAHAAALGAFGIGRSTGSGFPDESAGLLRAPEHWQPLDQATLAFGQGVNVTAVQLAAALAVFANDGVWRAPQLVRARRETGGVWRESPVPPGRAVLRAETARALRGMLETVTTGAGTGRRAALAGLRVAGKTGTAQKFDRESGRYSQERYRAWFAGIAPVAASARREASNIVVVTMVDEPRGEARGGGDVAAPLFARIASAALAREGVWTRPLFGLSTSAQYQSEEEEIVVAQNVEARGASAQKNAARNIAARGASVPRLEVRNTNVRIKTPSASARKFSTRSASTQKIVVRNVAAQNANARNVSEQNERDPLDSIEWLRAKTPAANVGGDHAVYNNATLRRARADGG